MKVLLRSMMLGCAALILATGAAWAQTTIYVNGAVAGSGDGLTPATAKKTVAEGLAVADAAAFTVDPTTTDLWTLFDAAVAWADNVTLPVTGGQAALLVNPDVITDGIANTTRPDGVIYDRLMSLGYTVQIVPDDDVVNGVFTPAMAEAKDLIFISESVTSGDMDNLMGVNVPVISCEPAMFDNWNWSVGGGANDPGTQISITNAGHPLAGGLSGTVNVYTLETGITYSGISEHGLTASAQVVATVAGTPDRVTIFGLEAGAALVTGTTPARRVGFLIWGAAGFIQNQYPAGLKVAVAQGTYPEAATLQMGGYRLEGGWNAAFTSRNPATQVTTLDGQRNKRIMSISAVSDFSVDGLTFFHGVFLGTDAATDYFGGALVVLSATDGTISNCAFTSNSLGGTADELSGGAVNIDDTCSSVVIRNCTFTDNVTVDPVLTVAYASAHGGALRVDDSSDITIEGCTFHRNYSPDNSGAAMLDDTPQLTFIDCIFTENSSGDDRAVMELDECDNARIVRCQFIGNIAGDDQIIYLDNYYDLIEGPDTIAGTADDTYEMYGMTIDGCLFKDNQVIGTDAAGDQLIGGDDENCGSTKLIAITNCVFEGNTVADDRLIEIKGLNVLIANCVFYNNNVADQELVAFYNDDDEWLAFVENPFVRPDATDLQNVNARLINNIFIDNVVGDGDYVVSGRENAANPAYSAIWTQVSNNIFINNNQQTAGAASPGFHDESGSVITPNIDITLDGRLTGNGNFDADPLFVNAATGDFHLQAASQAIDAGMNLFDVRNDRDGAPRPYGALHDIGAYEYTTLPVAPTNLVATPGDASVSLQWDAVTQAIGYRVYQSLAAGGPYTEAGTTAQTNLTVTGLTNGTTYYFIVRAYTFAGEGPNSNEDSATPQAGLSLDARGWYLYR